MLIEQAVNQYLYRPIQPNLHHLHYYSREGLEET